jgi:hypothetical protein
MFSFDSYCSNQATEKATTQANLFDKAMAVAVGHCQKSPFESRSQSI